MAILSHKLGPGSLEFGSGPLDASSQANKIEVQFEEAVETEEAIPMLSGEEQPEEETPSYKAKLVATFLQDTLADSGLIAYSWAHAGENVPCRFVPNDALEREVTGTVCMVPINLGGEVKKRNTSDVTMRFIGMPDLGDVTP